MHRPSAPRPAELRRSGRGRRILAPVAAGAVVLGLAACGSDDDDAASSSDAGGAEEGSGSDTATADAEFPIEIEHVYGTTVIESQPANVAGVEWGNHDVALALGVVPVGMPSMSYGDEDGDGILPWASEALDELGVTDEDMPILFDETDGPNFEQVARSEPDVILSSYSGLTDQEYELLAEIAPTVAYPEEAWYTSWRDMALINGAAMGMADEAEVLVADLEERIAAVAGEHPELDGTTFTFGSVDPEDTSIVTVFNDARTAILEEFGMQQSPSIAELFEGSEDFHADISTENLELIDGEVLVLYGTDGTMDLLRDDPLLSTIPAVESGAVAVIQDPGPLAAAIGGVTVLSLDWVLEDYVALLAEAAAAATS